VPPAHEPGGEEANRPHEFWRSDGKDRRRCSEPQLGEAPVGEDVSFGLKPLRRDDALKDDSATPTAYEAQELADDVGEALWSTNC
jgi:hypothetical protein